MKIRNSKGPSIEPCGTPKDMGKWEDSMFPNCTNCVLELRYEVKKSKKLFLKPYFESFQGNMS